MAPEPTVFFHVMKCGGTSVRAALASAVGGRGSHSEIFELDGEAAKEAAGGRDPENWRFRDALLPYVVLALRPALVMGHFRYRNRYHDVIESAQLVTVLRHPVDRLVSLYKYRRYKEGVDVPVSMSFAEFVDSKRWSKEGHAYVGTFCGDDDLDPRSEDAVGSAIANLRRFAVVGFTDRLDDFSRAAGACVGGRVKVPLLNESPAPRGKDDVDIGAALSRATEVCAPDLRLYEQMLSDRA